MPPYQAPVGGSFVLPWVEVKTYLESIDPDAPRSGSVGRSYRPQRCELCDHDRVWFNGWRIVRVTVLLEGKPYRFYDGLPW